jgi:flagellar motor switch/type III secretory pathway protein FliN
MLPCRLVLETPVINFTVATLMRLEPGSVIETAAQHNEDLLLHVNGQVVGTVKFDVTRDRLAVRLTGVA